MAKSYVSKSTGNTIYCYNPNEISGPAKVALDNWYKAVEAVANAKKAFVAETEKATKLPAGSLSAFLKYGQVQVTKADAKSATKSNGAVNAMQDIAANFAA